MEDGVGQYASKEKDIFSSAPDEKNLEDGVENDSDQPSPRSASFTSLSWVVLCSSLLLAEMQAALDSTMTANLQPTIINTFEEISKFPWINVTYSLGMGGSCLLW
jgi:hypothetical protein